MSRLLLLAICMLSMNTHAAEFLGSEVRLWAGVDSVVGDLDAVQLGFTFEWKYAAIDLSTGVKRVQWSVPSEPTWEADEWQSGSAAVLRVYPFKPAPIRPLILFYHSSDVARGTPFNDEHEPTSDFIGLGATVAWKRAELDITFGRQLRECSVFKCGDNATSNEVMIRFRGIAFGARK